MRRKIVENWLINASERGYQIPFAISLLAQGYKVIHVTRHCGMELGKDILAINPSGEVCAYQLKAKKKIKLKDWRGELQSQVQDLVNLPVEHPSIEEHNWHHSYLVVNGELEEEVSEAISKYNRGLEKIYPSSNRKLKTILIGEMVESFVHLNTDFWPIDLYDEKLLIELLICDGRDIPDIQKITTLTNSIFEQNTAININKAKRVVSNGILLTSLISSSYVNEENYYSEYICWALQQNRMNQLVESETITHRQLSDQYSIVRYFIENAIENLYQECKTTQMTQGHPITDPFVINARRLISFALCSYRNMIYKGVDEDEENWVFKHYNEYRSNVSIVGEVSFVYVLILAYYMKYEGKKDLFIVLIKDVVRIILLNESKNVNFPNIYYSMEHCLLNRFGSPDYQMKESFLGFSYILESCIKILVQNKERSFLEEIWKDITRIGLKCFQYQKSSDNFKYRTKEGRTMVRQISFPTSWKKLQQLYSEKEETSLPKIFEKHPKYLIDLLLTFPHRMDHHKVDVLASILK